MAYSNEWKKYFRPDVLRDGYNLNKKKRVSRFQEMGNTITGEVYDGTRNYASVQLTDDRMSGSCSCGRAKVYPCKHIAALLFHKEQNTEPEKKEILFDEKSHEDYYFNVAKMAKNLVVTTSLLNEAKQLIANGTVHLDKVDTGFSGGYRNERIGIVYGTVDDGLKSANVQIRFTREKIEMADCYYCHKWYYGYGISGVTLCSHQLALLMLLDDYIRKFNPGDETDRSGTQLLNAFTGMQAIRKIDEKTERAPVISLEPRLTLNDNLLQLSFKIGTSKMYVLKNMQELCDTKDDFGILKLGKNNELRFQEETFTAEAEKYYAFIRKQLREEALFRQRVYRKYGDIQPRESHSSFELLGQVLDDFYDLAYGKTVEFSDKSNDSRQKTIHIGQTDYRMTLHIHKRMQGKKFTGVEIDGEIPPTFAGARNTYFINGNTLAKLKEEDVQFLQPFRDAADDNLLHMVIGTKNLSEFYYRILPSLREHPYIEVEEDEDVEEYLPPEAKFDLYLDIDDDFMTCTGRTTYDDHIHVLKPFENSDFPLDIWRDGLQEEKAVNAIAKYFPNYDTKRQQFMQFADEEQIYDLLNTGIRELMEIGNVHGSDAFNRLRIRRTQVMNVGVSLSNNLLDLEVLSRDMEPDELVSVLESYVKKKKFHRLKSGEFISFDQNESLEMLTALMNSLNISIDEFTDGKLHLPVYRALYLNKMLEEHDSVAADRDRGFRSLVRSFNAVKDSEYDVPEGMGDVLRNYQVYGYKWMRTLADYGFGGILADDMGLGKTIQMIAYIQAQKEAGETKPTLIVCPASVVYNWAEEFARFAPGLRVTPLAGSAAVRSSLFEKETDVFVTSYDLLKRDIGKYKNQQFACEVLDEGQYIKNPKAAVSKSVKIINADHRFVLTGTPIENRLSELWSIFDFLMPGFLYTYDRFRQTYETPIAKDKDEVVTERLRKMVSPFILRRLKQDVLKDLPEKMEEVRYAKFDDKQQQVYDGQVVHMKEMIGSSAENENKIAILAELTRIRQICCDPSLIFDNYEGESAKKDACLQLIESAIDGGHKMLVFSQFTSMLDILKKELDDREIPYYVITGATSKEERMRLVHRFNENDIPVFLISLKAGGTGLNLTGADVVIHYDPWWNLAAQNQATDRAHRIGQQNKVTVYRIIAKDTIEEKILELQEAKKDLSDAILSGETTSLGQLSREELLELLS